MLFELLLTMRDSSFCIICWFLLTKSEHFFLLILFLLSISWGCCCYRWCGCYYSCCCCCWCCCWCDSIELFLIKLFEIDWLILVSIWLLNLRPWTISWKLTLFLIYTRLFLLLFTYYMPQFVVLLCSLLWGYDYLGFGGGLLENGSPDIERLFALYYIVTLPTPSCLPFGLLLIDIKS